MPKVVKIAISLPADVLQATEERRLASGQSRSDYIREALEERLRREQKRLWDEQSIRAYREHPETPEEVQAAEALTSWPVDEEPWD